MKKQNNCTRQEIVEYICNGYKNCEYRKDCLTDWDCRFCIPDGKCINPEAITDLEKVCK